jgi:hypothetical protein
MTKHPAGPFRVSVTCYRIAPLVDTRDTAQIYSSFHRSPHAAGRRLASIIREKTNLARDVRRCMPRDYAGKYMIETGSGTKYALNDFRAKFCSEESSDA